MLGSILFPILLFSQKTPSHQPHTERSHTPITIQQTNLPRVGELVEWLNECESILRRGLEQTKEIAEKQITIRNQQLTQLIEHTTPPLDGETARRQKRIESERDGWTKFSLAHTEFLQRGINPISAAPNDAVELFLQRAYFHVALGIVYLKNVFIFTFSMRGKDKTNLLKRCRSSLAEGASVLGQLAPTLSKSQISEHSCLYWTQRASAFHLLPQLMLREDPNARHSGLVSFDLNQPSNPEDVYKDELHRLAAIPAHLIDYRVLLEFLPYGLDPTLSSYKHQTENTCTNCFNCCASRSAIQLARHEAEKWRSIDPATLNGVELESRKNIERFLRNSPSLSKETNSIEVPFESSILCHSSSSSQLNALRHFIAWPSITDPNNPEYFTSSGSEDRRRKQLHIAFLLELEVRWQVHSKHVYRKLVEASPRNLLPDLCDIVADYLDLEPQKKGRASIIHNTTRRSRDELRSPATPQLQ